MRLLYDGSVEMTIRVFRSFAEADAADVEEDLRLTPEQRIALVLELQSRVYPNASEQGFARVCRVTQHERS
jgi:hypothetical protein